MNPHSSVGTENPKRRRNRAPQPIPADLADKRVLNTNKSATLVGLSVREWERLRAKGKTPPPIRLGTRKFGYVVADLLAWIESRKGAEAA